jgi:drug/metabolite transporter (DMT)-like permease
VDGSVILGVVLVTLAAASWGTWTLFLRPPDLPSQVTTPIVFAVMAVVTLPFAFRGPRTAWDRKTLWLLLGNAAFDALNVVTYFAALARTTVAIAVLTHYFAPILIAMAAPRVDGMTIRGARPAAVVALAGLVIVLEPWESTATGAITGALLGLASAGFYMGNVFVVRRLADRIGPVRAMAYHALIATAAMAPFGLRGYAGVTTGDLGYLVTGGASIGAVSGVLFIIGLRRIGAARAAVLTFAEPLVAVVLGAVVYGEPLHPIAAAGGAAILGAGVWVARAATQPAPRATL